MEAFARSRQCNCFCQCSQQVGIELKLFCTSNAAGLLVVKWSRRGSGAEHGVQASIRRLHSQLRQTPRSNIFKAEYGLHPTMLVHHKYSGAGDVIETKVRDRGRAGIAEQTGRLLGPHRGPNAGVARGGSHSSTQEPRHVTTHKFRKPTRLKFTCWTSRLRSSTPRQTQDNDLRPPSSDQLPIMSLVSGEKVCNPPDFIPPNAPPLAMLLVRLELQKGTLWAFRPQPSRCPISNFAAFRATIRRYQPLFRSLGWIRRPWSWQDGVCRSPTVPARRGNGNKFGWNGGMV